MIRCNAFVRRSLSCLAAPAILLSCGAEDAARVEESGAESLGSVNGKSGAADVTGPEGPTGATGPTGPQGLPGADGANGPRGPAGPAAAGSAAPTGPVPYAGEFVLDIAGFSGTVALSSFAGCFDQFVGVLYEDCAFEVEGLPSPVLSWLAEMLGGADARHDLTVRELDTSEQLPSGRVVAQIEIDAAWIRDFQISDFDAAATGAGKLSFVVVPDLLTARAPTDASSPPSVDSFSQGDFTLDIPDVDRAGIVALSGLHLRRDRLAAAGPDPRRAYFAPGTILFDDLRLTAQSSAQSTLADLTGWVEDLGHSPNDHRDGLLTVSSGSLSPSAEIHLPGLTPFTGLSLVGERRSITLLVQSFDLVPTP
jgi:hypothetical protein